jgi:hypothetical protein
MKDEATGALQRLILIPTKMRYAVPAIVTDYLYMKTEFRGGGNNRKAIRTLQSVPDPVTNTGSYALIPDIQYPTYAKLRPFFETAYGRKFPEPTWTPPTDE